MHSAMIFDVDGTLIDGTDGILKSLTYTMNLFELPPLSDEVLKKFVGPPIQQSCKTYFKMTDEEAQNFTNIFRQKLCDDDLYFAKVYDGIYELLEFLKSKNIKLGVATYKREDLTIKLLEHFNLLKYFNVVCGADNDNKLTKIDILISCINKLSITSNNAIMIGDSHHDAEAAQKLNMNFIGVTYGFGFKTIQDVNKYPNIFCANTPSEITWYLKTI